MVSELIKGLWIELKDHPLTMLMLVILVGWTWHADLTHAKQADMVAHLTKDTQSFVAINNQYTKLMRITVASAIQSTWITWCGARNSTRVELNNHMNALQLDYAGITGRDYSLPECEDILP